MRVFNKANQAIGEQPKALAASVVAYAVQLIDPDSPDFTPVMQRIAHKHVSLGIKATEYTIVGQNLMWAIGEVLGDAVTPEIAAAWDEVYWLFALQLVAEEAKLYAIGGTDPEHPWRRYRVTDRVDETAETFSLEITPVEGTLPPHRTGQYVAIAVDLPGGERQPRQYTISGVPGGQSFRVTIKRVRGVDGAPDGQVSNWLGDNAQIGTGSRSPSRAATSSSTKGTTRSSSSPRASASPRWRRSSRTSRATSPSAWSGSFTPTAPTPTTRSISGCSASP